jgi:hypothetical protein
MTVCHRQRFVADARLLFTPQDVWQCRHTGTNSRHTER